MSPATRSARRPNELTQQWDGYFPRLDQYQGFNTLDRFQAGGFYWIDVAESITWRVPKAEDEEEG